MLAMRGNRMKDMCTWRNKICLISVASRKSSNTAYSRRNLRRRTGYIGTASVSVLTAAGFWWSTAAHDDETPRHELVPRDAVMDRNGWKEEVTRLLSRGAYSHSVIKIPGITRYDGVQLAASSPCEDRFFHGQFPSPWSGRESPWMAWAVLDGHCGWQTSEFLERQLLSWVRRGLANIPMPNEGHLVSDEAVHSAIQRSFVDLDDSIIKSVSNIQESDVSLPDKMKLLARGFAGSCALLAMYDPKVQKLHVACTGDSRAVLGQQNNDGTWKVVALSIDQTGYNEEEIQRLSLEHPGEIDDIVKNGRVQGLAVSRAFGDGKWKWPRRLQHDFIRKYYGPPSMHHRYDSPPYLTAEPVVTSTYIDPQKRYFLIMATDGLWDFCTSQQGVDLVAAWLQESKHKDPKPDVVHPSTEFNKPPFEFDRITKSAFRFDKERTTVQDDNAAVHLLRNALGGNVHELLAGRLATDAPFARKIRDDITIQVVFFDGVL